GMGGDDRHGGRRDGVVPHVRMKGRAALWLIGAISVGVVLLVAFLLLGHRRDAAIAPTVAALPLLNACLNATSAALLTAGYLFIRDKRVAAHRACMVSALVASSLFLVSYVTYHALAGSRPFGGQGWVRRVYFPLLVSHVILAAAIVRLARVRGPPAPRTCGSSGGFAAAIESWGRSRRGPSRPLRLIYSRSARSTVTAWPPSLTRSPTTRTRTTPPRAEAW